jgi:hypothetical protein
MSNSSFMNIAANGTLDESSPLDTIAKIKHLAIRRLEALDSNVLIQVTDYFNHTFAPDLVLRWPRSQENERYVYLRGTNHIEYLVDDVERIGNQQPIVLAPLW